MPIYLSIKNYVILINVVLKSKFRNKSSSNVLMCEPKISLVFEICLFKLHFLLTDNEIDNI